MKTKYIRSSSYVQRSTSDIQYYKNRSPKTCK